MFFCFKLREKKYTVFSIGVLLKVFKNVSVFFPYLACLIKTAF